MIELVDPLLRGNPVMMLVALIATSAIIVGGSILVVGFINWVFER